MRGHFPIFTAAAGAKGHLAYLDSAASAQKPQVVIDRLSQYLSTQHANIHRGAYALSARATELYEAARTQVAKLLNLTTSRGVIFTRGTTESINLVSRSLEHWLQPGEGVLLSVLEHHSNIVPWQLLAQRRGIKIAFLHAAKNAAFDLNGYQHKLASFRPKLVAMTHIANSTGTVFPIAQVVAEAHRVGARVLIDAAQSVAHCPLDMPGLGADFMAFSGHKMYGPTGVGVLACREEMYEFMEPFQGGGDMISTVSVEGSTWAEPPQKFEAGTPAIAEVIALGTAVEFLQSIGLSVIEEYERQLFEEAFEQLRAEPGVTLYGPGPAGRAQASILSFTVKGVHPHDLATIADSYNVQIRAGHHCAQPAMRHLGVPSTARASLGVYSCRQDIEALLQAIRHARKLFS